MGKTFCIDILTTEVINKNNFKKKFTWWSLLGVAFSLTNSWLGISSSLVVGISSGGPMLIIYGSVIGFVFTLMSSFTLIEFSTLLPNSSGPCFWVLKLLEKSDLTHEFSVAEVQENNIDTYKENVKLEEYCSAGNILVNSRRHRNTGLITGLINYFGSLFTTASICSSLAMSILGVHATLKSGYELKKWHVFVTYQCINFIITIGNMWSKPLPLVLQLGLYVSIITYILTFVISLVCRSNLKDEPWPSGSYIFGSFSNNTGWGPDGIAFLVGLINPLWAYVGIDSATHMIDEVGHIKARKLVPQVILTTVLLGFVTSFTYCIGMFYCITDKDKLLHAILPIIEIYEQATGSRNLSVFMQSLCIICGIFCGIASTTWQSRILWSLSKDFTVIDNNMGSKSSTVFFSAFVTIDPVLEVPLSTILFSNFIVTIIGCIYIGSTTAFNAIITASISLLLISYAIPSFILLFIRGRKRFLTKIYLELTNFGIPIRFVSSFKWYHCIPHIVCIAWALFCLVLFSFPFTLPVTPGSMNYVSVVYAVVAAAISVVTMI